MPVGPTVGQSKRYDQLALAAALTGSEIVAVLQNGTLRQTTIDAITADAVSGAAASAVAAAASAVAAAASAAAAVISASDAANSAAQAVAVGDEAVEAKDDALLAQAAAEAAAADAAQSAIDAAAAAASGGLFTSIVDKSADFAVVADTDNATLFKVDSSGGNINATLPSIASAGEAERYGFLRTSASNSITLVRNGSDTINGVAGNYTLPAVAGEITLIFADDTTPDNWIVTRWGQSSADGTSLTQTGNIIGLNTANTNVFTAPQRHTPLADNDGSFDLNARQDFTCTPTGAVALTFTNKPTGQKGTILFVNGSNYAITRAANVLADSGFNELVSATGTYIISYWSYDGTNVGLVATPALT